MVLEYFWEKQEDLKYLNMEISLTYFDDSALTSETNYWVGLAFGGIEMMESP